MEAVSGRGAGRSSNSVRSTASIVLAVIGGVLALIGAVLLYARTDIIDQDRFAEHASEALADEGVRDVVATEIVVQLARVLASSQSTPAPEVRIAPGDEPSVLEGATSTWTGPSSTPIT